MDAIISIDAERHIILFNTAAEKMFGCATIDALGNPLTVSSRNAFTINIANTLSSLAKRA